MTTFQDPQPQSRRAVRQSERGEGAEQQDSFVQPPPPQASPQFYSEPAASRDMWDTTSRRAAQLPPAAVRPESPSGGGRRAAPAPVAEPLTYSTQSTSTPSYDGPSFRSRTTGPAADEALAPTQAIPQAEQPSYRVRDFSPEGRRAAPLAEPSWSTQQAPQAPAADLEYHTEARAAVPAPVEPIAQVPPFAVPVQPEQKPVETAEQTLSRRELRALQHAQEAAEHPELVQPEAHVSGPAPVVAEPPALVDASPFEALFTTPAPEQPAPLVEPLVQQFPSAPEPDTNTALTNAIAEFDALTNSREVPVTGETPRSRSVNHWSAQADAEDEFPENTISRRISSGSTATNALVLPSIPLGDIRGPLTGTGEIMLTGSIDLPRNLASTGQTDRFDHDGIDELFDLNDAEVVSTDSSPVRAIRAVSTHTSGHGVTHTQKPKGTKALTALLIAASSMAVVVAGLLVAAFAFNVF